MNRRLANLEDRARRVRPAAADYSSRPKEFYARLTDEELDWMLEPAELAKSRVACPVYGGGCGCDTEKRSRLGIRKYPDLRQEFVARSEALWRRREEIMQRTPMIGPGGSR